MQDLELANIITLLEAFRDEAALIPAQWADGIDPDLGPADDALDHLIPPLIAYLGSRAAAVLARDILQRLDHLRRHQLSES